jgi:site-specific DNA-methyltransferase (adenine-specific)
MLLLNGDCIEEMQKMIDEGVQVDSVVTDPPYELGFMGKSWDSTGIAFQKETWELAYQLLKPGGHLLAFSSSRTYHRMAVAIEDAGFEIRDQLMWIYGSGFPKSYNIGKGVDKKLGNEREVVGKGKAGAAFHYGAVGDGGFGNTFDGNGIASSEWETTQGKSEWEGWGTALKPAHEPIVMARKPLEGTVADNVLKHGTGGINIDGCRIQTDEKLNIGSNNRENGVVNFGMKDDKDSQKQNELGRFPANVMHDGSEEVVSGFPNTKSTKGNPRTASIKNQTRLNNSEEVFVNCEYDDEGSAARFFYCPKVSKSERGEDNTHPTVKPQELMKYLCRLVTPKDGTVLDPFMGSGSTGMAAKDEGFDFIGIEQEKEYFEIADSRINITAPLSEFFE